MRRWPDVLYCDAMQSNHWTGNDQCWWRVGNDHSDDESITAALSFDSVDLAAAFKIAFEDAKAQNSEYHKSPKSVRHSRG